MNKHGQLLPSVKKQGKLGTVLLTHNNCHLHYDGQNTLHNTHLWTNMDNYCHQ